MKIEVLTLFPEFVEQVVKFGIPRKAVAAGSLELTTRNFRDYSEDGKRRVDDRPYGGGPGMVMEAEPLARTIEAARQALGGVAKVVSLSPQGAPLTQAWVRSLAREAAVVLICGRYEGLDERVSSLIDVELSLGDFVLSGGELAAMVLVDAVARWLPGAIGHEDSAANDSFANGLLDHPHYTRPEVWRGTEVPDVLLSGDHKKIARWRMRQSLGATWLKRPDLLDGVELDEEQTELLQAFIAAGRSGGGKN